MIVSHHAVSSHAMLDVVRIAAAAAAAALFGPILLLLLLLKMMLLLLRLAHGDISSRRSSGIVRGAVRQRVAARV